MRTATDAEKKGAAGLMGGLLITGSSGAERTTVEAARLEDGLPAWWYNSRRAFHDVVWRMRAVHIGGGYERRIGSMSNRKEITRAYKERKLRGGVYTITNTVNGKYLIGHAANMASVRNHFQFAVTTGSAVHPKLRDDWATLGGQAFRLDVLEELEQGPEQSQADFLDELNTLEQLWSAHLGTATVSHNSSYK